MFSCLAILFGPIRREKQYFTYFLLVEIKFPIGRNKIVYQANKNILGKILFSLFYCFVNTCSEECDIKEEYESTEEIKVEHVDEEYITSDVLKEEYYPDEEYATAEDIKEECEGEDIDTIFKEDYILEEHDCMKKDIGEEPAVEEFYILDTKEEILEEQDPLMSRTGIKQ